MESSRPLVAGEAAMARTGTPAVSGVTVHGPLDVDALARAADQVCAWHPVLRCRITAEADGYRLAAAPHEPPPRLRETERCEDIDSPFAPGEPLLRAAVIRRPADACHRVALAVHHAVADGVSGLALLSRLWQTYTALVAGKRPPAPPVEPRLPRPAEELLAERHPPEDIAAWLADQAAAAAGQPPPARLLPARAPAAGHGAHLHTVELPGAQVVRLYRAARRKGTTPAGMLSALVLLAARTQLRPVQGPLPLALGSMVDLRSRTAPPIPAHRVVQASSFVPVTAQVSAADDPAALGRAVDRQLASARADAYAERQVVAMSRLPDGPVALPFTAMLSNLAAFPLRLTLPPGTSATELFAYAPPPGPVPTVFVTRTRQALGLHLATPRAWFHVEQATGLARSLTRHLTAAMGEEGARPRSRSRPTGGQRGRAAPRPG
ncbi:phthiocerol/phthiodiolone dimycocerosyl transferase family protein [Streptomyces sp. 6N223]|uniref:phthiocerol/phthiodiolone dimycocerosyl transferase family protein n=1 Tax=Streptomyces sp. 6N223 TaxID=3457412 RepID=UPI003FD0FB26